MTRTAVTVVLVLCLFLPCFAQPESSRLKKFKALTGAEKVRRFLSDASRPQLLGGLSSGDCNTEQEILITSDDVSIQNELSRVSKETNKEKAAFAISLLCTRASFVPRSEFLVPGVEGGHWSHVAPFGLYDPFVVDMNRLTNDAAEAVRNATTSSDPQLKGKGRLYCGQFKAEEASKSATELAAEWRAAIAHLKHPIYYEFDKTDEGIRAAVLRRLVIGRALDGAAAVAEILRSESQAWARELELELIQSIDEQAVRLRASETGREVIAIAMDVLAKKELFFPEEIRAKQRSSFEAGLLNDRFARTSYVHFFSLLDKAFRQFYGDHTLRESSSMHGGFIGFLTLEDPYFPSWEFVPTLSDADMLHPRFRERVRRFHDAWTEFRGLSSGATVNH
jgi:hypothetical protein